MKKACILPILVLVTTLFIGCTNDTPADAQDADISTEEKNVIQSELVLDTTEMNSTEETAVTETIYGVTIRTKDEQKTFLAEDNTTCVLDATASYPEVTVKDSSEVTEKINTAILTEVENYWNFENGNVAYAKEDYNASVENQENTFEPYTASFSYTLKRCDDRILSFVICQYDYTGGAHGNPWSYGLTFDMLTGERLQLAALSDNGTEFYNMVLQNIIEQSSSPAYQEYIFDDFALEIESSLLKDSTIWYLDDSGISFISNPYVLGSYAAGTFEFNIAYEELPGLKSAYQYEGHYVRKIFPGIAAKHDLNGDGAPDEILYKLPSFTEDTSEEVSLVINETDFSKKLISMRLDYPWAGSYYLTDIDAEDKYVEIAILNDSYDNGSLTHFFRYTEDNQLTYIGNVNGLYSKGLDVRYNSNGNLVLSDTVNN